MSKVENLNKTFLEFCDDLENVLPSHKKYIDNAREKINANNKTKYYLEYYFRHCFPYVNEITLCDQNGLSDMSILHGVKFSDVFSNVNLGSQHALWKYLHTFYLLIQSYSSLDKIVEKYHDLDNIQKIKDNLENHDQLLKNIMNSSTKFAEEILKEQASNINPEEAKNFANDFMKNVDEKDFENKFLNSGIGNLAKEISNEIDPKELENLQNPQDLFGALLGGNGNAGGLQNIIKTVGDKLQNKMQNGEIDQNALMQEASSMMGMLGPAMQGMGGAGGMGGLGEMMNMFGGMGMSGKKKKRGKSKRK